MRTRILALAALAAAQVAHAEVLNSGPGGFTTREMAVIAAPPAAVWRILLQPSQWWSSEHSFSGDARNFHLDARPGGEWTESLPGGGGVRHMTVVYVAPASVLRLEGPLGPLQAWGVSGHLTFALKAQGQSTAISETYDVGGHSPDGLDKVAGDVDGVLGRQLARLKARVETGHIP